MWNFVRGLFEKDKLVFSFMLCVDIMKISLLVTDEDWNYFVRGPTGVTVHVPPKPDFEWLHPGQWNEANNMNAVLRAFKGLRDDLTTTPVWISLGNLTVRKTFLVTIYILHS